MPATTGLLPYALTAAVTRCATEAAGPALLLAAIAAGRGPETAAFLLAALTASAAITGPLVGSVLDSSRTPVRVFLAAMGLLAASFLLLGGLIVSGPLPLVFAVAVVGGLGQPALTGGWSAQVSRIVQPERQHTAYAIDGATYNLGALLGPAIAAVALGAGPRTPLFLVAALVAVPMLVVPRIALGSPPVSERPRTSALDGLRALVAVGPLRASTTVTTIGLAGQAAFAVGAPTLAVRLTGGLTFAGILLTCVAIGGLVGAAVQALRPLHQPERVVYLGTAAVGVAMAIVAVAPTAAVAASGALLAGCADGLLTTSMFVIRNRDSPDHARGQVFTVAASLRTTAYAITAAGLAPLAGHPEWALGVGVGVQVLAVALGLWTNKPDVRYVFSGGADTRLVRVRTTRETTMRFDGMTALVTGASSGIGAAFASRLAADGADLVLVARRKEALDELAARLAGAHGHQVTVLPADLDDPSAGAKLVAELAEHGLQVDVLVNNAGFGLHGDLADAGAEADLDRQLGMVRLNCLAVTDLTARLLPGMRQRGRGVIVNVASTAAFQPLPHMAVYGATKAFVLSFSEALWAEAKPYGVKVLALCPGATATEFFSIAGEGAQVGSAQTPEQVVDAGMRALERGRPSVISGWRNRLLAQAPRLAPRAAVARISERTMRSPG